MLSNACGARYFYKTKYMMRFLPTGLASPERFAKASRQAFEP